MDAEEIKEAEESKEMVKGLMRICEKVRRKQEEIEVEKTGWADDEK